MPLKQRNQTKPDLVGCRGVRLPQRVSCIDTKQSDGEAPVMQ